eukprot:scaffold15608_cov42-Phaeocystis_antarctica.AAC.1
MPDLVNDDNHAVLNLLDCRRCFNYDTEVKDLESDCLARAHQLDDAEYMMTELATDTVQAYESKEAYGEAK